MSTIWPRSKNAREERIDTPFGAPSDSYFTGDSRRRAGRVSFRGTPAGTASAPTEINYRANICGFKILGCDAILSASAVRQPEGRIRRRGHAVVPDQFVDRTRHRRDTFFGEGLVAHVVSGGPGLPGSLGRARGERPRLPAWRCIAGGTYVCMEGPQFSTRAESFLYRSWGADVIGMTNLTEARLAREAGDLLRERSRS